MLAERNETDPAAFCLPSWSPRSPASDLKSAMDKQPEEDDGLSAY